MSFLQKRNSNRLESGDDRGMSEGIRKHGQIKCPSCGVVIDLHEVEIQSRLEWEELDKYPSSLEKNKAVIF
jgi:hypothetical protein